MTRESPRRPRKVAVNAPRKMIHDTPLIEGESSSGRTFFIRNCYLLRLMPQSRQLRVFRARLPQKCDVWVGVLRQREEVVVSASRFPGVAGARQRFRQLQARHGIHGVDENDASMIENPLEFAGGVGRPTCREVRESAHVDRVQTTESSNEADAAKGKIVARRTLQGVNRR